MKLDGQHPVAKIFERADLDFRGSNGLRLISQLCREVDLCPDGRFEFLAQFFCQTIKCVSMDRDRFRVGAENRCLAV